MSQCPQMFLVAYGHNTSIPGWHFKSGPRERSDPAGSWLHWGRHKTFVVVQNRRLPTLQKAVSCFLAGLTAAELRLQKKTSCPQSCPTSLPPTHPPWQQKPLATTSCRAQHRNELETKVSIIKHKNFQMMLLAAPLNSGRCAAANPI